MLPSLYNFANEKWFRQKIREARHRKPEEGIVGANNDSELATWLAKAFKKELEERLENLKEAKKN